MHGLAALAAWVAIAALPVAIVGQGAPPSARLTCDRAPQPGRVRCDVEARAPEGGRIRWGDAVLVAVPPFATALRGRIGPRDATVRDPDVWRWPFAVVARARGAGDLTARIRLVVCRGEACAPETIEAIGRLQVGE